MQIRNYVTGQEEDIDRADYERTWRPRGFSIVPPQRDTSPPDSGTQSDSATLDDTAPKVDTPPPDASDV